MGILFVFQKNNNMRFLIDHFNLNKTSAAIPKQRLSAAPSFRMEAMRPPAPEAGQSHAEPAIMLADEQQAEPMMSVGEQLFLYFGTALGVLFSSWVAQFDAGSVVNFHISVPTVILSAIVAIIIVPFIFNKLSIRPNTPLLFRFAFFVQNGVSWHIILGAIGKTIV